MKSIRAQRREEHQPPLSLLVPSDKKSPRSRPRGYRYPRASRVSFSRTINGGKKLDRSCVSGRLEFPGRFAGIRKYAHAIRETDGWCVRWKLVPSKWSAITRRLREHVFTLNRGARGKRGGEALSRRLRFSSRGTTRFSTRPADRAFPESEEKKQFGELRTRYLLYTVSRKCTKPSYKLAKNVPTLVTRTTERAQFARYRLAAGCVLRFVSVFRGVVLATSKRSFATNWHNFSPAGTEEQQQQQQ